MQPFSVLVAASTSPPFDFTQLGTTGVICVVLSAIVLVLWRQHQSDLKKIEELNAEHLKKIEELNAERMKDALASIVREREVSERTVPMLVEATRLLDRLERRP